jgi:hypothetical protein
VKKILTVIELDANEFSPIYSVTRLLYFKIEIVFFLFYCSRPHFFFFSARNLEICVCALKNIYLHSGKIFVKKFPPLNVLSRTKIFPFVQSCAREKIIEVKINHLKIYTVQTLL